MKDIDMRANSPKLNKYPPALPEDIYSVDFFCRKRKIILPLFMPARVARQTFFRAAPRAGIFANFSHFFASYPLTNRRQWNIIKTEKSY